MTLYSFTEEDSDALRETFILRKTSLSQAQWDKYLSSETSRNASDEATSQAQALLGSKSSNQGSSTGDGAVVSRKSASFDVETGASVTKISQR